MNINFDPIVKYLPYMLGGAWVTLKVAFATAIIGSVLGLLISFGTRKKGILKFVLKAWVDFFRGTPLLFQLMFFHYALPQITGWIPTPYVSAIIVFSLNSSA